MHPIGANHRGGEGRGFPSKCQAWKQRQQFMVESIRSPLSLKGSCDVDGAA